MRGKRTTSLIAIYLLQCLFCIARDAKAQKNGFRGGSKSYEIHVEASPMGTNLHYELPESKVKAASKQDWLVDNDNADMLAINSPVLATVNVKHPKFSMKGQWPGYTTSFKLPEDVSVASKRHDFSKSNHVEHQKIELPEERHNAIPSSGDQASEEGTKADKEPVGTGVMLSKVAGRFFKRRKPGRNSRQGDSLGMLNISKLLLPIARLRNIDLKNPHVNKAMKGIITGARKVVDEAKMVLNDAAGFITGVRKLIKVTKEHKKMTKTSVVVKETEESAGSKSFAKNVSKQEISLSQEKSKNENGRMKSVKSHRQSLQLHLFDQKYNRKERHKKEGKISLEQGTTNVKGVSKRSYLDSLEAEKVHGKEKRKKVKRRELPDTLESILYTISGLKNLLKYH